MSQSFIQAEAEKNATITNEAIEALNQGWNSPQDSVALGNLIGAAAGTFASIGGLTPGGSLIKVVLTTANGAAVNYGITVSEEGEHSVKAVVTSATGAVVSTIVAESLSVLVGRAFAAAGLAALTTVGAPVTLTIAAGALIVGASYVIGNAASYAVGKLYDYFITENTKVENTENNVKISTTNNLNTFLNDDKGLLPTLGKSYNWEVNASIPSVNNPDSFQEQLGYNKENETVIIDTADEKTIKEYFPNLLKELNPTKAVINSHTAQVINMSQDNIHLRNALEAIDDYHFLLSDVLIHPGEKLDMGPAGIITVKPVDTLSELAVRYLGGDAVEATRQAVLLNPWLADDGRIEFIAGDKVLAREDITLSNNRDHYIRGEEADDLIKDANGGNDTLIGLGGDDLIYGGDTFALQLRIFKNRVKQKRKVNLFAAVA